MSKSAIRSNFHQALDVERNLFPQIAFDAVLLLDDLADFVHFVVIQFAHFRIHIDAGGSQNVIGLRTADAIDIGKSDLDSLIWRKIYTCYTCHSEQPSRNNFELRNFELRISTLALFVFRIDTNHAHDTFTMHDFALVTDFSYGSSNFHNALFNSKFE